MRGKFGSLCVMASLLLLVALATPLSGLAAPLPASGDDGFVVVLKGTPAEIGKQYGEQAKPLIAANVALFQGFAKRAGLSPEEVLAAGKDYETDLLGSTPELVDELKGMAETSGVVYEWLLAFNALGDKMGEGCTTLLATGKATQDGKTLFQKNRDANRGYQAVMQVTPAVGYKYIAISNPGRLGVAMGVNEKGVSIGNNVLSTWDVAPKGVRGLGNLTINQYVLEQAASARQAVDLITGWTRSSGSDYPVADPQEAAFVETTYSKVAVKWVVDEAMAHTNHYILPGMEGYDTHETQKPSTWYLSTEVRLARANSLLQADLGKLDVHRMVAISEDQDGPDGTYWIDAQAVIDGVAMGSVAAGTFDGSKLRMWAQLGQPSVAPAVPFDVNSPLVPGPFNSGNQSERIDNTGQNRP